MGFGEEQCGEGEEEWRRQQGSDGSRVHIPIRLVDQSAHLQHTKQVETERHSHRDASMCAHTHTHTHTHQTYSFKSKS